MMLYIGKGGVMSINFTGSAKIKYVSPKDFEKLITSKKMKEVGAFPHYTFNDKVKSKGPMYSQYANTCSILDINDTMVHLAPEYRTHNLIDKITDLVKKEKAEKGDVTAFIIGGKSQDKGSFNLFNDIANILDREGTDFSMICGKQEKPKHALDSLCKDGDTFIFTQEYSPKLEQFVKENKSLTGAGLKKVFELFYDFVEISPKHQIIK